MKRYDLVENHGGRMEQRHDGEYVKAEVAELLLAVLRKEKRGIDQGMTGAEYAEIVAALDFADNN